MLTDKIQHLVKEAFSHRLENANFTQTYLNDLECQCKNPAVAICIPWQCWSFCLRRIEKQCWSFPSAVICWVGPVGRSVACQSTCKQQQQSQAVWMVCWWFAEQSMEILTYCDVLPFCPERSRVDHLRTIEDA